MNVFIRQFKDTHTFSTSQTEFSHLLCTCQGWNSLGTSDSVLCLMPLGQALSQLPVRGSRVWWLYRHLPLSVCFAEKLNTVLKHTHTYETTRRGLSCQIFLLLSPASSKQVPLFRWCCCLLTICAQFWDSQSQECQTGLAKNSAELVPVCALGNRARCVWLWAAPVQQRGGEGHNPAGKGHCWEPKELKSHWWHASYKN